MSSKTVLKGFFQTGLRPKQAQFEDMIDSMVSAVEANTTTVRFDGGLILGNSAVSAVAGAMRWTGTNFEFHNGAGFQPITLGGGISNPQDIGNVRVGSTLGGAIAAFAHITKYNDNDFAFGQTPSGNTIVSSGTTIFFQNRVANVPTNVMQISTNKVTINTTLSVTTQIVAGTPAGPPIPVGTVLAVYGEAQKSNGAAWTVMSDARVKKDISGFSEGLEKLLKVNPVRFKYKNLNDAPGANDEQVGVLAQEIKSVFPYMVSQVKGKINKEDEEEAELLTFNSSALQFVIINAIKELNNRIQSLELLITKSNN